MSNAPIDPNKINVPQQVCDGLSIRRAGISQAQQRAIDRGEPASAEFVRGMHSTSMQGAVDETLAANPEVKKQVEGLARTIESARQSNARNPNDHRAARTLDDAMDKKAEIEGLVQRRVTDQCRGR